MADNPPRGGLNRHYLLLPVHPESEIISKHTHTHAHTLGLHHNSRLHFRQQRFGYLGGASEGFMFKKKKEKNVSHKGNFILGAPRAELTQAEEL